MDDIRLRSGMDVAYVQRVLQELVTEVDNLARGTIGLNATDQRDAYLRWIEKAESQLRSLFVSVELREGLHSSGYWALHAASNETPQLYGLVRGEATRQHEWLQSLADRLREAQQLFALPVGQVAVMPDTNVFAHYRPFDEIPWQALAKSAVRIVIPLLVLEELDELSYRSRPGAQRAKDALRTIAKRRGNEKPETPVDLQSNVTFQLLTDPPRHVRRSNNDDELLTRAEYLATVVGKRISIATGDYGMQVRATARELGCIRLPDELRLGGA